MKPLCFEQIGCLDCIKYLVPSIKPGCFEEQKQEGQIEGKQEGKEGKPEGMYAEKPWCFEQLA